eukprot:2290849-Karenia_brevis.AAC.1
MEDRDSNDECENACLPQAREHLPDDNGSEDEMRSNDVDEEEPLSNVVNRLDLSGYESPNGEGNF